MDFRDGDRKSHEVPDKEEDYFTAIITIITVRKFISNTGSKKHSANKEKLIRKKVLE